jgi:hypothetical protein
VTISELWIRIMSALDSAIEQIEFARNYTLRLLDHTDQSDWYRSPPGGVTHIAWQVGHLAIAEYFLACVRIRGERPEDEGLIPAAFRKPFERQSVPDFDAAKYPRPAEIREVLDRVHAHTLQELRVLEESELDRPILKPHALVKTKCWALLWCAQHEAVHAGQIGLLRRLLGYAPIW